MFEIQFKFSNLFFLIYVITFIFIAALLVQFRMNGDFTVSMFYAFGGEIPSRIAQGDIWLLVTANFFHIDVIHYIFNLISLKRIGDLVENFYDGRLLFSVFMLSGIGGTLLTYIVALITRVEFYSLGASAGVFGLVGLLVGGSLKKYRYGLELPFSVMDILPFVAIAFLFGFLPGLNVNNWAHLGGFVVGVISGLIFSNNYNKEHRILESSRNILYYLSVAAFVLSYAILLINFFSIIRI